MSKEDIVARRGIVVLLHYTGIPPTNADLTFRRFPSNPD
jgi:hypothetical protein